MSDLQIFRERNEIFAAQYQGGLQIIPKFNTFVLTCGDARIDPAHFLGLELGDAFVFRNAGARVSDELELELGILWAMAGKMAGDKFKGFGLAIIHHTDCGFERLASPELVASLSKHLNVTPKKLTTLANHNHLQAIYDDIERLRQSPLVPKALVVSGHIYDTQTGILTEIVASAPLAEQVGELS